MSLIPLTLSRPLSRPLGFAIYVAASQHAPFAPFIAPTGGKLEVRIKI
jgi:hypothetical protein